MADTLEEQEAKLAQEFIESAGEAFRTDVEVFQFGEQVKAFQESHPVGVYLTNRMHAVLENSVTTILDADDLGSDAVAAAHLAAKAAQLVIGALREAVAASQEAEKTLRTADFMDQEIPD